MFLLKFDPSTKEGPLLVQHKRSPLDKIVRTSIVTEEILWKV